MFDSETGSHLRIKFRAGFFRSICWPHRVTAN